MGVAVEKRRYTVQEYLDLELEALERHEYHDGEILAMAGGTYSHSLIKGNLVRELGIGLKGKPCRVLESDLRVRIQGTPFYVYPDVNIICGQPQFDLQDKRQMTILNPRVIVEVLSPSTEAYDREEKFNRYREIDSFEEYVLVAQDQASVATYFRQHNGTWLFTPYSGTEATMKFRCLNVDIQLAEIYAGIEFPDEKAPAS